MEQTLPKIVRSIAELYPDVQVQYSRNKNGGFDSISYHTFFERVLNFAGGLLALGEVRGNKIGLISDNRAEWEQADLGLLAIGAIDTPRGCDATEQDLSYILSFAECTLVIAENTSQVKKIISIKEKIPRVTKIISFDAIAPSEYELAKTAAISLYQYDAVIANGLQFRKTHPCIVEEELERGKWDDLASIIFTSGTTGTPKGVMLSHGNFITQLDELQERIFVNPGEKCLCILPVWHVFQRACEYVLLSQGGALCYSKPIGAIMLDDMQKLNPQILPGVPRVYEAVYDGIWKKMKKAGGATYFLFTFFINLSLRRSAIDRKLRRKEARFGCDYIGFWWIILVMPWLLLAPFQLLGDLLVFRKVRALFGKKFRAGIAGGGAFSPTVDRFFWAVGVNIVEGYGLTETAPVVCVRPIACPVLGTIGTPIRGVQVRIVDDDGYILGRCRKGNVQVCGGTVMKGYYRRPDLTAKVMTADGWFDTGDIGILTVDGELQLRGRKKDTIVLSGGENVEPVPIEQKINTSPFVAASVVVGQDQRCLGALILPKKEDLLTYAESNGIHYASYEELVHLDEMHKLFEEEINERINARNGFKTFERVNQFAVITKPFEIGVELSAKQEMMRYKINEMYTKEITSLFEAK
jgi:long-chain acyl-CoA synthetase